MGLLNLGVLRFIGALRWRGALRCYSIIPSGIFRMNLKAEMNFRTPKGTHCA